MSKNCITVKTDSQDWPFLHGMATPDEDVRLTLLSRDEEPYDEYLLMALLGRDDEPIANFPVLVIGHCPFTQIELMSRTNNQMSVVQAKPEAGHGAFASSQNDGVHFGVHVSEDSVDDIVVDTDDFREFTKRLEETIHGRRRAR